MIKLPFQLDADTDRPMGLLVLQADETLEGEFASFFGDGMPPLYVSRVPSGAEVTEESLGAMETHLPSAARLLPNVRPYGVVGYACTSASAVIGSDRVAQMIRSGCEVAHVTDPLRAAIAQAHYLGLSRLALVSPYIEEVNEPLRRAFAAEGLSTDVFGSFEEREEANVARISTASIVEAAIELGRDASVEGVFLSCTNLRTLEALPTIRNEIAKPVLSSNQCLAWHMKRLDSGQTDQNTDTE